MNVLRGGSAEEGSGQRGGKKRYMQRHRSKSSFTEKKRRLGDTNNAAECVAGRKRGPHCTALPGETTMSAETGRHKPEGAQGIV